jgi:hypothetical protein
MRFQKNNDKMNFKKQSFEEETTNMWSIHIMHLEFFKMLSSMLNYIKRLKNLHYTFVWDLISTFINTNLLLTSVILILFLNDIQSDIQ